MMILSTTLQSGRRSVLRFALGLSSLALTIPSLVSAASQPTAPSSYSLPSGGLRVTNGAELERALASWTPQTIILAPGEYDSGSYFKNWCGHRVYAESSGQSILRAGMEIGSGWCSGGAVVQGLSFDVSHAGKTFNNAVIHLWGNGRGSTISDVTMNGNSSVGIGIALRDLDGVTLRRISAKNFSEYGVQISGKYESDSAPSALLEDVDVSNVSHSAPRSSRGTAEACVWVANRADLKRVRARDCAWADIWTGGNASGSTFSDITVDGSANGVGIYLEHYTTNVTFSRVEAGPNLKIGAICEWADPDWGGRPACDGVVFEESEFKTSCVGVYLDEGTMNTTVRSSTFAGQSWASIGDYRGFGNLRDTTGNAYSSNGIATGHYYSYCY